MAKIFKGQVMDLRRLLSQGQISRREFIRSAALLGLSLGVSEFLAACGLGRFGAAPTPYPTGYDAVFYDPTLVAVGKEMVLRGFPTSEPGMDIPPQPQPPSTSVPPKKFEWLCVSCGKTFTYVEELKKHVVAYHAKRLPEIQRVEKPTYSQFLVGNVERFDQRNHVISRTRWDEKYQAQMQAAAMKAPPADWDLFEGLAMVSGAIYVDDTAGILDPNYTGYNGHYPGGTGLYSWDDPVNPEKFPFSDPAWMSERVKSVARLYGADLVGITRVNPSWVYSHTFNDITGEHTPFELPYKYAIVMGIEMNWEYLNTSPKPPASAATALAYSRMAELSSSLAKYIRALGYTAVPAGNDSAQSIPLAIDAGLGELGRNGLLLSPEFGPRQRLCKVFTDLPLQPDQPIDFGMSKFCETCFACAQSCPSRAIRFEDRTTEPTSISNRKGILRWPVNVSNCFLFWLENNGVDCSNCIAACPWALRSTRDWLET